MAGVKRDDISGACFVHEWELRSADPVGAVVEQPGASDRAVQFAASTWGGATAVLKGSIDGVTFFTLSDPQGNILTATDDRLEQVMENVRFYKAELTIPGTDAAVKVSMISRSTMR